MSIAIENEDEKRAQTKHCVATNKTKAIHRTHTQKKEAVTWKTKKLRMNNNEIDCQRSGQTEEGDVTTGVRNAESSQKA